MAPEAKFGPKQKIPQMAKLKNLKVSQRNKRLTAPKVKSSGDSRRTSVLAQKQVRMQTL